VSAYVDSSAVLRVVLGQPGAIAPSESVRQGVTSALTRVECLRTIERLRTRHAMPAERVTGFLDALDSVSAGLAEIDLDRTVLARAGMSFGVPVGTLDAIHLASALLWRERNGPLEVFATHDEELALAARAAGFLILGR
jgi:predicted nucleic acid-binding protein